MSRRKYHNVLVSCYLTISLWRWEAVSTTTTTAIMLSLLTIIGGLVALYLARFPYNLARNYIAARKMGLPIIIVPIDQHHLIWMLISVPLRPVFKVRNGHSANAVDYSRQRQCSWLEILTPFTEISAGNHLRKAQSSHIRMGVPPWPGSFS